MKDQVTLIGLFLLVAGICFFGGYKYAELSQVKLGENVPDSAKVVIGDVPSVPDVIIEYIKVPVPLEKRKLVGDTLLVPVQSDAGAIADYAEVGFDYAQPPDYVESRESVKDKSIEIDVHAWAPVPVDSFRVKYRVDFDRYYRETYQPHVDLQFKRMKRSRWYWLAAGVAAGAIVWEVAR